MNEASHIFVTCIGLLALWTVWHYGWKAFALDRFRQDLFTIRADLFALAADEKNGLQFTDPAYIKFRQFLNGRIRFAHRISFIHIVVGTLLSRLPGVGACHHIKSYKSPADIAVDAVPNPELKGKLKKLDERAGVAVVCFLALTSPLFFLIIFMTGLCVLVLLPFKRELRENFRQAMERELGPSVRAADCQVEALDSVLTGREFCVA